MITLIFYMFLHNEQLRKILRNFMDKFLLYYTSLSLSLNVLFFVALPWLFTFCDDLFLFPPFFSCFSLVYSNDRLMSLV